MIAKEFEDYLLKHEGTLLTPASNLAVLVDTHNVDHAMLLLSQMTYSRIPVVTDEKKFVGTISLTDILAYRMRHELPEEKFMDESFLPVVGEDQHFYGIITRKSILKAMNALLHDFSSHYEMKLK